MPQAPHEPKSPPRLRYLGSHAALRRELLATLRRELNGDDLRARTRGPLIASTVTAVPAGFDATTLRRVPEVLRAPGGER